MINGYKYDAMTNTLTISASFARKASKVGSPEYNLILKLRRDNPGVTIQKEEKKNGKDGLTYGQMEEFIKLHRDGEEVLKIFERVKKLSRIQSMPYLYVKTWFEDRYPDYADQHEFDDDGFIKNDNTTDTAAPAIHEVTSAPQDDSSNDNAVVESAA